MENILLKKSYHVKDLKTVKFNSLWGYNGVFTTIRISGKKPNLVLIDQHLKKLNKDSNFFGISFKISKQFLINFINTNSKIKNYNVERPVTSVFAYRDQDLGKDIFIKSKVKSPELVIEFSIDDN